MRIMITGATGMIGIYLAEELGKEGHDVIALTRDSQRMRIPAGAKGMRWDGRTTRGWLELLNPDTAIINLAGEPLRAFRWSQRHKERVLGTRIETARAVLRGIHEAPNKPRLLIQPSYIGYFGDRGDEILTESSPPGSGGFRAEASKVWERATNGVETRRVILRMGHVLYDEGGVLPGLRFAALIGGTRIGKGSQYFSWVHIEDVLNALRHVLKQEVPGGVYNLTAPNPCTMDELMAALHNVGHYPKLRAIPNWALNLALGKEQATVLTDSTRAVPDRLTKEGFRFKYDEIEWALRQLLRGKKRI